MSFMVSKISDHGGEFENKLFEKFCENGSAHEFSAPRTPTEWGFGT